MQISSLLRSVFAAQPLHGLGGDAALPDEKKAGLAKQWPAILMLTLVFSAAYYFFIFNKALIELELETDTRTILKVYWPNQHGNYSEKKSAQLLIKPGQSRYQLRLANLSGLDRLRLDPSENKPASIILRHVTLRQSGLPLDQLRSREDFAPAMARTTTRNAGGATGRLVSLLAYCTFSSAFFTAAQKASAVAPSNTRWSNVKLR